EGGLKGERRLCYVGITRPERDLYLTCALSRTRFGTRNFGGPSRFLSEIPAQLTDHESQQPRGFRAARARATSWDAGPPRAADGWGANGGWGGELPSRGDPPPAAFALG